MIVTKFNLLFIWKRSQRYIGRGQIFSRRFIIDIIWIDFEMSKKDTEVTDRQWKIPEKEEGELI